MLYNDWYISTSTYLLIYCLLHLVWTIIWPNLFLLPVYRARCSSPHNADHPSLLTYLPCVNIITATRSSHSLPRTRNRLDSGHDRAALSPQPLQKDILRIVCKSIDLGGLNFDICRWKTEGRRLITCVTMSRVRCHVSSPRHRPGHGIN